jgi:hypothetical protein
MHGLDAVWRNSCSRFKHYVRHSAIRSPKPDQIGPIGLRVVDGDLFSRLYCMGDSIRSFIPT